MRISDILHTKGSGVVVISPRKPVRELVQLLADRNLGAVVVSGDAETIEGIVSERDIVRQLNDGTGLMEASVSTIMTPAAQVQTCGTDDRIEHLMELMTEQRVRHVPVVDDGVLAGVVSIGDVVKNRISELRYERDELQRYVAG